jgi:curved DNA-binding protein CbpA
MGDKNYYAILGIGRDADDEAVKQAFRERAKECHPDLNPGDTVAEQ